MSADQGHRVKHGCTADPITWTPVGSGLPADRIHVLVTVRQLLPGSSWAPDPEGLLSVHEAYRKRGEWRMTDGTTWRQELILAWAPMPTPFQVSGTGSEREGA